MHAQDFLHNQCLQLLLTGDYIFLKECWCYLLEINGSGVCGENMRNLEVYMGDMVVKMPGKKN